MIQGVVSRAVYFISRREYWILWLQWQINSYHIAICELRLFMYFICIRIFILNAMSHFYFLIYQSNTNENVSTINKLFNRYHNAGLNALMTIIIVCHSWNALYIIYGSALVQIYLFDFWNWRRTIATTNRNFSSNNICVFV